MTNRYVDQAITQTHCYPYEKLHSGVNDAEVFLPNFIEIISRVQNVERDNKTADFVRQNLECFRRIAQGQGYETILTELAILDDEFLKVKVRPAPEDKLYVERPSGAIFATESYGLQFVSILAAYGEFGNNDKLLRAWHNATNMVVAVERRAIIGESNTY